MTHRTRTALGALALALALPALTTAEAAPSGAEPDGTGAWCTSSGYGAPRPVPHRARQERIARRALRTEDPAYSVERARPTHLGVVALVSGDVDAARDDLRGVTHVVSWTDHFLDDLPPRLRMREVLNGLLAPDRRAVTRALRGVPGRATTPYVWARGAAIVVEWKAPVPRRVRRLAGVRPSGVEVRVLPRLHSGAELQRASDRLLALLDDRGATWSSVSGCASAAGLELGVPDVDELVVGLAEIEEAAGMRVHLVDGVVIVAVPA